MKNKTFDKVFNYCCKLLKYRDRSEYELRQKLNKKFVDEDTINKVIDKLRYHGFLNEQRFVDTYVSSQIKKGKSLSLILLELKEKFKVAEEYINSINFDKYKKEQISTIVQLLQKKYKGNYDYNKIYRFLSSRGHEEDKINEIFNILVKEKTTK